MSCHNIPFKLIRHFIRGVFDGDGCWYYHKRTKQLQWSVLSGSRNFICGLRNHLIDVLGMGKVAIHSRRNRNFLIQWGGKNQLRRIYNYFYENSTICLDRKKQKAHKALFGV